MPFTPLTIRLLIILLALSPLSTLRAGIQAFRSDSLSAIEQQYQGKPFILAVWSLECPPCRDELALFGRLKQAGRPFNLVLVSTDDISAQPTLTAILTQYQLQDSDAWAFDQDSPERLRYSIDPGWFGEMPRCYFYDSTHNRTGISGKLDQETLIQWLDQQ